MLFWFLRYLLIDIVDLPEGKLNVWLSISLNDVSFKHVYHSIWASIMYHQVTANFIATLLICLIMTRSAWSNFFCFSNFFPAEVICIENHWEQTTYPHKSSSSFYCRLVCCQTPWSSQLESKAAPFSVSRQKWHLDVVVIYNSKSV